ncbi:DUF3108 domain-containing protein [Ancylobacter sonchi]|uniref:DUF3108 domain-containing protein n=1 Tax=Ancylobacter sonchi TaxID=1937790 RepID=UPI001BD35C01|nr:DUF3108 domain-containing protein [Ancylobacter sonchi]MBS7533482.1 DUF3108 domain-containing protein [Ancylobacter sonchi]
MPRPVPRLLSPSRLPRLLAFAGVALAGTALAGVSPALADGKLEARYKLSLAGLELGRAAFLLEVDDNSYTASGSARLTGVVQAISSGKGSAGARGTVQSGALVPRSFAMEAETEKKAEAIRLSLAGGNVTDAKVEPPVPPADDRVPMADKDKRGVLDPMTAALFLAPGSGDLMAPKNCERLLPVFDGRQRYDLDLSFERVDQVKAEKGYAGPALVCRISYKPVAGHRANRTSVKFMMRNKEMYVWLAPVAGTRVLAPFRASVATAIGVAQIEAVSFQTEPMVAKGAGAAPAKAGVQ